jgi:aminobenzoyl-glutamate transport protein
MDDGATKRDGSGKGVLDWIERIGNMLPDPVTLFVIGAGLVVVLSQVADSLDWTVTKTVTQPVTTGTEIAEADGLSMQRVEVEVRAVGLLTRDSFYWAIKSMVDNFVQFPPLGIVLVGMLGIGVAEKTGAIGTLLKAFMLITPQRLLTPSMVFIGVMSSMALDAGYVVLPPVAAALYKAVGRSPLVGLAAVFAGVSAGFSANLLPTGLDPLLAGFTQAGAQILDPTYRVAATCNWWFMIASTILLTLVGWVVTASFVEPRYERKPPEEGGPSPLAGDDAAARHLTAIERKGLAVAGIAFLLALGAILAMILIPGAPLHGQDEHFDRWVEAIVPILFVTFLVPGVAYGISVGTIRSDKETARLMGQTMADMGPYIVLAFFAGQFVAYFAYSHLGEMLAIVGGQMLASADLPTWALLVAFIVVVMFANLFVGSASGKYAFLAPVFVPMFMAEGVNISPELTQAAYRIGDSASNVIAPLNPYLIIILVFMQRYVPRAGIGTLVSLMLPYAILFFLVWSVVLVVWVQLGFELGPQGPLTYSAP